MSGRTTGGRRGGNIEKPWASGRVLTPEQRARKQEADRKANRFLKKEVQDRLTLLEARVQELENPSESAQGGSAVRRGSDAHNAFTKSVPRSENSQTRHNTIAQIPDKAVEWSATVPFQSVSVASDSTQVEMLDSPAITAPGDGYFPNSGVAIAKAVPAALDNCNLDAMHANQIQEAGSSLAPDFTDVTTTARTRPDGRHMTCFLNNLVNYIRNMAPGVVCFDDQFNQDLIVAAVMEGWEHTLARYQQKCPLWDVLRLVDTYLFKDCNFVERISVLRMLHKRYLYEVNANLPTAGPPPPWFRPQFSEKVFFYDPVIDHLTWPQLRERLISSEQDKMTNKFWSLFVRNLRVTWRYEPIDIMTFSADTQLYQLTPMFEESIMDMGSWRMDMDFFRGIPQLAGDVPPYNYMPLQSMAPKFGGEGPRQQPMLAPRFGLHPSDQEQRVDEVVPPESWMPASSIPPPPGYPGDDQLGGVKMSSGGIWPDFYSRIGPTIEGACQRKL